MGSILDTSIVVSGGEPPRHEHCVEETGHNTVGDTAGMDVLDFVVKMIRRHISSNAADFVDRVFENLGSHPLVPPL